VAVDAVSWLMLIMMPAEKATPVPSRQRHKPPAIGGQRGQQIADSAGFSPVSVKNAPASRAPRSKTA
jgi:hypothetical protein